MAATLVEAADRARVVATEAERAERTEMPEGAGESLVVRVVTEHFHPIGKAEVGVWTPRGNGVGGRSEVSWRGFSDESGMLALTGGWQKGKTLVVGRKEGFLSDAKLIGGAGETTSLVLRSRARARVAVIGPDGAPAVGVAVHASMQPTIAAGRSELDDLVQSATLDIGYPSMTRTGTTDGAGSVVFENLSNGTFMFTADAPGLTMAASDIDSYVTMVRCDSEVAVRIQLYPVYCAAVRTTGAMAQWLWSFSAPAPAHGLTTRHLDEAKARLEARFPDAHVLAFIGAIGNGASERHDVVFKYLRMDGKWLACSVKAKAASEFAPEDVGVVHAAGDSDHLGGSVVVGCAHDLFGTSVFLQSVATDSNWRVEKGGEIRIPGGTYRIVCKDRFVSESLTSATLEDIELPAGGTVYRDVVLRPSCRPCRLRVMDEMGLPMQGYKLSLRLAESDTHMLYSRAMGLHDIFTVLEDGKQYDVTIEANGFKSTTVTRRFPESATAGSDGKLELVFVVNEI